MNLSSTPRRPPGLISLISILFVLFIFQALPARGEPAATGLFKKDAPVEITADYLSYDKKADTYYATGHVLVVQGGVTMKTEGIMMDAAAGKARTVGKTFIYDTDSNTLEGRDLWIDLKKNTAVIANARIFYKKENLHIEGDPLKKTGKNSYEGKDISYSTCDCPRDSEGIAAGDEEKAKGARAWSFYAKEAKLTIGGFLTAKHAFFRIKDYPVLYTPYLRVAVQRERQTGFLMPSPGYSELRGVVLDNAFFWAISRSRDATFYLDIETARGFGGGLEYRYVRSTRSYGTFYYYAFVEKDIERVREFRKNRGNLSRPPSASSNRWQLKFDHTELLAHGFNIRANIDVVSDDEYLVDFGTSSERSVESLESNISLSKSWSIYSLVAQLRTFDNLLLADDSTTLRKLPEVTLTASDKKIPWTPFYRSLNSSYINFSRSEGVTGHRVDLQPTISLPLSPGGYFDFKAFFTPRGTFYLLKENPGGRYVDRYLYKTGAEVTTTFVRTFHREGRKVNAFKHTIRPKLSYEYIPEAVQDNLPSFDSVDLIAPTNAFTYSLNSILTGRTQSGGVSTYHDYVYFELRQSYDIYEATRKRVSATDKKRPFSDITAEAILKPTLHTKVTGKVQYNVYDNRSANYDVNLDLVDSRGDSLTLSHRFVRDSANFIEGSLKVRLNRAFDLSYLERYSIDDSRALETTVTGAYHHQCWGVNLTFSDTLEETLVYISFNLKGIGNVAGFRAR